MSNKQNKRVRGLILSPQGWQKLQDAKIEWEFAEKQGYKVTLEEMGERSGLTSATISKILTREEGVDKRSIVTLFSALNLELTADDCTRPDPKQKLDSQSTLKKIDWGEAIDVSTFFGRTQELAILEQWVIQDRCRLITLIGMGGIGKTSLSVKLAWKLENKFDYIIWRSLRDVPPLQDILTNIIQFLSEKPLVSKESPETANAKISLLIRLFRSSRCLLVLDNIESLMCDESRAGICREEYQEYDLLFQRLGESAHQSCVLLTTREKPKEVAFLEGESFPVRSIQLDGIREKEGEEILKHKGIDGTDRELAKLVKRYNGNPLALKIVGTTIRDLFQGNLTEFLRQDSAIFGDIRDVLAQQLQRLIDIEKKIVYWLAINREPITTEQLQEDLVDSVTRFNLLDGLDSLSRRCLIEKTESDETGINNVRFTLQSVVMEYVTNRLIEEVCQEIFTHNLKIFRYYALMKANAKDYIKNTQVRLIIQPIITRLFDILGRQSNIEERLEQIKITIQETSPRQTGYVAGNILNLLCYLGTDLTNADFSNLCIWQADLQNVCLHNVSFQNADLKKTIFSETFSGIISVTFSSDGKILAAGDSNGEIHLWRVADNQPLQVFRGHTSWITSLDFSPDDTLLVSGSSDSSIKLWNVETGECLQTLDEHQDEIWSIVFSLDGEMFASGSDDYTIRIWRTSTGECLQVFQEHTSWVTSLAFNFHGNMLASSSNDLTIRLWNFHTGECLKVFQGHSDGVRSVCFSPNDQILISGSDDHTIRVWDVNTGECLKTLDEHRNRVFSLDFNHKTNILASGSHDRTVRLWNITTGKCIKILEEHSNWVFAVAFNSDGNILASGSRDQTVKLWDISKGKCMKTFQGYSNQVLSVCFSPDNQRVASGSQDRVIRLWNITTGECSKIFRGHLNCVYSVAFSPQGDRLISGSGDKTIKLWDVKTNRCLRTFKGHSAAVRSVAFSPNGYILASAGEDCLVTLWNVNTGQVLKIFKEHTGAIWSIAFSPDGKTLASSSFDRTIKIWDVETGECLKTLAEHETWVWSVSFSPDGKTLGSSSPDGTVKIWDISTGKCKKSLSPPTGWLLSTSFSKNGKFFAASSQDCTIKLWDTKNYELIKTFHGHESGFLWSVAFSFDSQIMASCGDDETINLWNILTGQCLNTIKAEGLYKNMNVGGVINLPESTKLNLKTLGIVDLV